MEWSIEERIFELKYNWKLSRNETTEKTNLFVRLSHEGVEGIGEIAPNIRYKETPELIKAEFHHLLSNGLNNIFELNVYKEFIQSYKLSNSFKMGLESAITAYYLNKSNTSFSKFYNIEKIENIATSYTIPIIEINKIFDFITDNELYRFKKLKLKINNENPFDFIKEVTKYYKEPLLIDANEAWYDVESLIIFLEKLDKFNIELIEQPMPESNIDEYIYLKKYSPYPIFADESIKEETDLESIAKQFDGINIKLMKTGGPATAIKMIKEAEKFQLQTMIGCMVETTLGISTALNLSKMTNYVDLDGFMLIKNEPFNLIKEHKGLLYYN